MSRATSNVTLYRNAPFDPTYKNIFNYTNGTEPYDIVKDLHSIEHHGLSYISINKPIRWHATNETTYEDLVTYNYLRIKNPSRTYYAFIDHMEYRNDGDIEIFYTIDYWTTYWKKLNLDVTTVIDRATISQNFNSEDAKRAFSVPDPALIAAPVNRIVDHFDLRNYNDNRKWLFVYYLAPYRNISKESYAEMMNGTKLMMFKLPKAGNYDNINADIQLILMNTYFYDNGKCTIVRAEVRERDDLKVKRVKFDSTSLINKGSDGLHSGDYTHNYVKYPKIHTYNAFDNTNGEPVDSDLELDKGFDDDFEDRYKKVSLSTNSEATTTPIEAYVPVNSKETSFSKNIGNVSSLFDSISVNNIKLLSAPFSYARINAYGNHQDYDLASYNLDQYNKSIKVVRRQSIEAGSPAVYEVLGLNGIKGTVTSGDVELNTTKPFVTTINNSYPIQTSDSLAWAKKYLSKANFADLYGLINHNEINLNMKSIYNDAIKTMWNYYYQKNMNNIDLAQSIVDKIEQILAIALRVFEINKSIRGTINAVNTSASSLNETNISNSQMPAFESDISPVNDKLNDLQNRRNETIVNAIPSGISDIMSTVNNYSAKKELLARSFRVAYNNSGFNAMALENNLGIKNENLRNNFMIDPMADNESKSLIGSFGDAMGIMTNTTPQLQIVTENRDIMKANDSILMRYGNRLNKQSKISDYFGKHSNRHGFSFIKVSGSNVKGTAPNDAIDTVNAFLNAGVSVYTSISDFKSRG